MMAILGMDVEDLRLRFVREHSSADPALDESEVVIWSHSPERLGYLLYWISRVGLIALTWSVAWLYVASRNAPFVPMRVDSAIPLLLATLGILAIAGVLISSVLANRFLYLVTNNRVILFDKAARRSRFVCLSDIDRLEVVSGLTTNRGAMIVVAGSVITPDGNSSVKLRLAGISNLKLMQNAINRGRTEHA